MQQSAQNMRNKTAWERQQMQMRNMQRNLMRQEYDNHINDIIRNYQIHQMTQQNPMMQQQPLPQQNIIQSQPVQQPVDQSSPSSPVTQEQLQIVKEQIMMEAEQKFGSH